MSDLIPTDFSIAICGALLGVSRQAAHNMVARRDVLTLAGSKPLRVSREEIERIIGRTLTLEAVAKAQLTVRSVALAHRNSTAPAVKADKADHSRIAGRVSRTSLDDLDRGDCRERDIRIPA